MMPYILHTATLIACSYALYRILLLKETFYQLNRYLLLACLFLSFLLPFATIPHQWAISVKDTPPTAGHSEPSASSAMQSVPDLSRGDRSASGNRTTVLPGRSIDFEQTVTLVAWLYWVGVAAFGLNFLVQLTTLGYRAYASPYIQDGRYRIVELSGDQAPCSFGNTIFINPEKYDWETYEQILQHEKVHARQGHTLDLMLAEAMLVFQWFNPFAWLYRRELENNLEFLTDDQVIQQGRCERSTYQMSLIKVAAPHFPLSLTTNYNQSLLKRRIAMMNAKKSSLNSTWKYLFLPSVLMLSVCLLNEPQARGESKVNFDLGGQSKRGKAPGTWLATLQGNLVTVQFFDQYGDRSSQFQLSELKGFSAKDSCTFSSTREAGTLRFRGSFKGNQGSGHYEFVGNQGYRDLMSKEGILIKDEAELMTFFLLDITNAYVQMLKGKGYAKLMKRDLTSLATYGVGKAGNQDKLDVPEPGSEQEPESGQAPKPMPEPKPELEPEDTDSLGVLINSKKNFPTGTKLKKQHLEPKKQHLDSQATIGVGKAGKQDKLAVPEPGPEDTNPLDVLINSKKVGLTDEYIKDFHDKGYKDIPPGTLINFKSVGVTADYIRSFEKAGYRDIPYSTIFNFKSVGVTPEYIKSFEDAGFKNIPYRAFVNLKATGATPPKK